MHFATPTRMEELLKKEKVKVVDDVIVDFEKKFWDPALELSLWWFNTLQYFEILELEILNFH